jgi:hypothetical protein
MSDTYDCWGTINIPEGHRADCLAALNELHDGDPFDDLCEAIGYWFDADAIDRVNLNAAGEFELPGVIRAGRETECFGVLANFGHFDIEGQSSSYQYHWRWVGSNGKWSEFAGEVIFPGLDEFLAAQPVLDVRSSH